MRPLGLSLPTYALDSLLAFPKLHRDKWRLRGTTLNVSSALLVGSPVAMTPCDDGLSLLQTTHHLFPLKHVLSCFAGVLPKHSVAKKTRQRPANSHLV